MASTSKSPRSKTNNQAGSRRHENSPENTDEKNEEHNSKSSRSSPPLEKTQTKSTSESTSAPADQPQSSVKKQEKEKSPVVICPSPPTEIVVTAGWTLPPLPSDAFRLTVIKSDAAVIYHVTTLPSARTQQRFDVSVTTRRKECLLCPGDPKATISYDSSLPLFCPAEACAVVYMDSDCEAWLGPGCRLIKRDCDKPVIKRLHTAPVIPISEINVLRVAPHYKVQLLIGVGNKIYIEGKTTVRTDGKKSIFHLHPDCREEISKNFSIFK